MPGACVGGVTLAILRGLRAPRVPHGNAIRALGLPEDRLLTVRLPGPGGRRLAVWLALPEHVSPAGAAAVLAMHGWQSPYLGLRDLPGEFTEFELQAFFSFSRSELELIGRRRGDSLKLGWAWRCTSVSFA